MCLLALFFRAVDDAPVIIGANREEYYARGGEPPQILDGPCPALAGVDPTAGGTWLGVNAHGVVVAVTNRRKSDVPKKPRSRGLLARDLLACLTAEDAAKQAAREIESGGYAGCNILCVDRDSAAVLQASDWLRVRPLPPGLHVLTAHDVNDMSDPRLAYALRWLEQRQSRLADEALAALEELCAQSGNGGPPICLHGNQGGTVSSSLIALAWSTERSVYRHAQGPPDRIPYADFSHLLHQVLAIGQKRGA
jgi:uncharacterized protein with NRDE domain